MIAGLVGLVVIAIVVGLPVYFIFIRKDNQQSGPGIPGGSGGSDGTSGSGFQPPKKT